MPPKKKQEMKQGIAKVTTKDTNGAEETKEEVVSEVVYDQPTCNVGFRAGVTRNMGNYNSLRVEVSLFMPCYPQEIEDTFAFTKEWVDNKMNETIESLDEL